MVDISQLGDAASLAGVSQRQALWRQQNEIIGLLRRQQAEQDRVARLPKCPSCMSPVEVGATVCSSCRREILVVADLSILRQGHFAVSLLAAKEELESLGKEACALRQDFTTAFSAQVVQSRDCISTLSQFVARPDLAFTFMLASNAIDKVGREEQTKKWLKFWGTVALVPSLVFASSFGGAIVPADFSESVVAAVSGEPVKNDADLWIVGFTVALFGCFFPTYVFLWLWARGKSYIVDVGLAKADRLWFSANQDAAPEAQSLKGGWEFTNKVLLNTELVARCAILLEDDVQKIASACAKLGLTLNAKASAGVPFGGNLPDAQRTLRPLGVDMRDWETRASAISAAADLWFRTVADEGFQGGASDGRLWLRNPQRKVVGPYLKSQVLEAVRKGKLPGGTEYAVNQDGPWKPLAIKNR